MYGLYITLREVPFMHGARKRTYIKQYFFLSLSAQLDAHAWIMAISLNKNLNLQLN